MSVGALCTCVLASSACLVPALESSDAGHDAGQALVDAGLFLDAGGDAGQPDAGQPDAGQLDAGGVDGGIDAGPSLWPVGALSVLATMRVSPLGPTCQTDDGGFTSTSTWDLTLATGELNFAVCEGSNIRTGTRLVSPADVDRFVTAMRGLRTSTWTMCNSDPNLEHLTVTTPSATYRYRGIQAACVPEPGVLLVEPIWPVFSVLGDLDQ